MYVNSRTIFLLVFVLVCVVQIRQCGRVTSRGRLRSPSSTGGRPAHSGSSWSRSGSAPRPSPNYGWNSPSRPASTPSRPSSSGYGWNLPSKHASSPSQPSHTSYGWNSPSRPASPSRPSSSGYGWNLPSGPSSSPSRPSPSSYGWNSPSRPASSPSRPSPSSYNWNKPSRSAPSTNNGWNVPSRPSSSPSNPSSSYGWNVPAHSAPSPSQTAGSRPSSSSWGRPSYSRPAPAPRPSPSNYGWNVPSHTPARPAPSPSRPSSNVGWNTPARPAPSPSRPSPSNTGWNSPSQPSPSRPAPSNYGWNVPSRPSSPSQTPSKPSPSPSHPAPSYGWNVPAHPASSPSKTTGTQASKPSSPWAVPGRESPYAKQNAGTQQSGNKPAGPPATGQAGWNPDVSKQVNSGQPKPPGWNVGGADQANKKTVGQQHNSYPQGPGRPYPTQGGQYSSNYQPGYHPGTYGYQPHGGYGGGNTIINNNNYHTNYGGYGGFGGYGYHAPPVFYPSYSYSYRDTGSTTLGFFLGYSLARLTTPSYYYYGHRHDSYRPVYDHYEIHHYYHNKEDIPKKTEVPANSIAVCVGDSGNVCPQNTYALCTSSGSIMCVADASATVPCANEKQVNCVKSRVPCVTNETEECRGKKAEDTTTVDVPCIYTTKVWGNITFVNNTIVLEQPPMPENATVNGTLMATYGNETIGMNVAYPTDSSNNNGSNVSSSSESPTEPPRSKRDTAEQLAGKQFCVTIVAEPAARKNKTESEQLFDEASTIFKKFAVKALGADRT